VIFLFFVAVTSITFRAFDCDIIDADVDPRSFLRADYSISCETHVDDRRPYWLAYACLMLLLWPAGVSCYVFNMFYQNRLGMQLLMEAQLRYDACVSNFSLAKAATPAQHRHPALPAAQLTHRPPAPPPRPRGPVGLTPQENLILPKRASDVVVANKAHTDHP